MTIGQALQDLRTKLSSVEQPFLEAEMFLQAVLGLSRERIHLAPEHIISEDKLSELFLLAERRAAGEPFAYLVGYRDFYRHRFAVGPGVLIPRPETELVVEEVLRLRTDKTQALHIADFGAGSGCIGLSLLGEYKHADLISVEPSPDARVFLKKNAEALGFENRVTVNSSLVEDLKLDAPLDVIVANPPYVDPVSGLIADDVKKYEPAAALFSDEDGFGCLRRWILKMQVLLKPRGLFVVEIGCDQGPKLLEFLQTQGRIKNVKLLADLSGRDRVVSGEITHG